jgi:hypothetical protein
MRWRRLFRHERQLQVVDDAVHSLIIRDEGDDLHLTAALGTDHRVDLAHALGFGLCLGPDPAVDIEARVAPREEAFRPFRA